MSNQSFSNRISIRLGRSSWTSSLAFILLVALTTACMVPSTSTPTDIPSSTLTPDEHTSYLPLVGEDVPVTPSSSPLPSPEATDSPLPTPTAAGPTPLPPPVFKPGTGVQVHLFAGDPHQTLLWAQGLGVEWVKQQVEWHTIEHGPDDFEWEPLDRAVDLCDAFGFKLLLGVIHAPDHTRPGEEMSGPPNDYAEFRRFMQQLAERYRGRVDAYELWNEPNLDREWTGEPLDPARFVALVAEGAEGVRAGDPDAIVISGAPAVTGVNDGIHAIDDRVFLRGMLEAGVTQWVDAIGAHPYGYANPPDARADDAEHTTPSHNDHPSFFFRDTLDDYRELMVAYGAEDMSIWITEFGWPSVEGMGEVDTAGWEYARDVTEQEQAEYVVRAFEIGLDIPWVGPMFLWNVNIATIWGGDRSVSAYSILRPDGSYRPAYIALRLAGFE